MTNDQRAEQIIKKYGFHFKDIPKQEIINLIQMEIANYQPGSSEYIRLLCGYLYCLGDIGCMVDGEWIDSLKNGGIETPCTGSRQEIINNFVSYYNDFQPEDEY